jgi:hypothetical protein
MKIDLGFRLLKMNSSDYYSMGEDGNIIHLKDKTTYDIGIGSVHIDSDCERWLFRLIYDVNGKVVGLDLFFFTIKEFSLVGHTKKGD